MQFYKLKLHNSDIKDILIHNNYLITCSRDQSICITTPTRTHRFQFTFGYINCLAMTHNLLFGTQTGNLITINFEELINSDFKNINYEVQLIHKDNICAMSVFNNFCITGSWDNCICVIEEGKVLFTYNLGCSVLAVKFYSKDIFYAGCEDGSVSRFDRFQLSYRTVLHFNPVRDIYILRSSSTTINNNISSNNTGFNTGSNTGNINTTSNISSNISSNNTNSNTGNTGINTGNNTGFNISSNTGNNTGINTSNTGNTSRTTSNTSNTSSNTCNNNEFNVISIGHTIVFSNENLIYKYIDFNTFLYSYDHPYCAGEGLLYCGSTKYKLNCESIWRVRINDGVYLAGSDGCIYFSSTSWFNRNLRKEGILEESLNISKEEVILEEESLNCIKEEDSVEKDYIADENIKIEDGFVYQKSGNEFVKLGKLKYDSNFTIEIQNKSIFVEFNKQESPNDIANRIILKNSLDSFYKPQIIDFINQNFSSYKYFSYLPVKKVLPLLNCMPNLKNAITDNQFNFAESINELKSLEMFVRLDVIRYLIVKNYKYDCSFLFRYKVNDRKEGIGFVRLVTNLYGKTGVNLELLRGECVRCRDQGFIGQEVWDAYEYNRRISMRKK